MRHRLLTAGVALALVSTGCGLGAGSDGPAVRTVLVDWSHDEFASFFVDYFPNEVTVRPGDTVEFKQTWTGEPHSVTMGTLVQRLVEPMQPFFEAFEEGGWEALPEDPPAEILEIEQDLPWMFGGETETSVAQNGAQPCYLDAGAPPKEPDTPCSKDEQRQPAFNGRQSYYNSGFIPYEGANGNTFRVPIAEDAEPGRHFYYCNYHGQFMSGFINVVELGTEIPSQVEVSRAAREELKREADLLSTEFNKAKAGRYEVTEEQRVDVVRREGLMRGRWFKGMFSGLHADGAWLSGINEFIPRRATVKVGERVSWVMLGGHTISFNVPEYFPIIEIEPDGTVKRNPKLDPPAGGAPEVKTGDDDGPPEEGASTPPDATATPAASPAEEQRPDEPLVVDAGTFGGEGFWSSGLIYPDPYLIYHLRFSKPGTYEYACLVHPPMVGTIDVVA